MTGWIRAIADAPVYLALMGFLGLYPVVTGLYWIVGAVIFSAHRERSDPGFYELEEHPHVSVLVAAHNEEAVIGETVARLLELDWPAFDVTVVDDGSTDRTSELLIGLAEAGRIRLVTKRVNEGKAMALNDALPLLDGEIVLIVDADGRPQPDVLRWMVPHFVKVPRVAAVTGNPRVVNTTTLLAKLQAIEFTATVSVLRRAQATWGRLTTFSGICTALRKSAIEDVGRFRVGMATEDIALAWQLQTAYADVRYEPRALFAMQVPETLPAWWSQRTRWARGLAQVLRANHVILRDVRARRMWPVWAEGLLSTLWSHLFFLAAGFWALALVTGVYGFAGNPIPNFWGLLIASVLVLQITIGLSLDGRYDHSVRRYALWIPIYPLAYWMLSAAAAVRGTLPGLVRARSTAPVTWKQKRYHAT
ncbi:MAG TPA: glycosyltransferase family 2 protein [Solirubrobacteraceae bacterium]|jgi:biofilm PGA synthesis N-glycosyltransferase PgaC|nr:glycosyltransferase family 2 protein [Solirubrobacteraceae bacterium]